MKTLKISCCLFLFVIINTLQAQQTIGLLQNDSLAFKGYTLFAPVGNTETYLIDNCGFIVQQWHSDYPPGQVAYLLENGNLLRTAMVMNPYFGSGGGGGRVELFSWDGDLLWEYDYSDREVHQHHDIEYLPNGNILLLAWERIDKDTLLALGREADITPGRLLVTKIVEVQPKGSSGGEIVWEWSALDHIIQDRDSSLLTYGQLSDFPERINLNYAEADGGGGFADWIHVNSIDYNAELDQIVLSARKFHEIWIIDHSTTTEEAASHKGGLQDKGGDLLYRWGNPVMYGHGTAEEQQLYWQHDATWIPEGYPNAGQIMLYNNGQERADGNWSSIEVINAPLLSDGSYQVAEDAPFAPLKSTWSYPKTPDYEFYSRTLSGVQPLPNGNTLICQGNGGYIFEVTPDGRKVWQYKSPVAPTGILSQGASSISNRLFRAYRYGLDYPAFEGKDLSPRHPVELGYLDYDCSLFPEVSTAVTTITEKEVKIYPNPSSGTINLEWERTLPRQIQVLDAQGRLLQTHVSKQANAQVFITNSGIYFLQINSELGRSVQKVVVW